MGHTYSTQESVAPGSRGVDLNTFKSGSDPIEFTQCRFVRINTAGTYLFYFVGDPTTGIEMTCAAGEQLDSSFVKITNTSAPLLVAAKAITVIY